MLAVTLELPRTWRARLRGEHPSVVLDRMTQACTASAPLPLLYQTDFNLDAVDFLRRVVGRYPLGAQLVRMARAAAAGEDPEESAGLAPAAAPGSSAQAELVYTFANRAAHTNYRMFAAADADTPLLPREPHRTYLMILNVGAVAARIGFDRAASADAGFLIAATNGFYELTMGTVSEVRALGVGGVAELLIVEGTVYPYPSGAPSARTGGASAPVAAPAARIAAAPVPAPVMGRVYLVQEGGFYVRPVWVPEGAAPPSSGRTPRTGEARPPVLDPSMQGPRPDPGTLDRRVITSADRRAMGIA